MQEGQAFLLPLACGAEQEPGLHWRPLRQAAFSKSLSFLPSFPVWREELRSQMISEVHAIGSPKILTAPALLIAP